MFTVFMYVREHCMLLIDVLVNNPYCTCMDYYIKANPTEFDNQLSSLYTPLCKECVVGPVSVSLS